MPLEATTIDNDEAATNTDSKTNRCLGILPARSKRSDTTVLLLCTDATGFSSGHVGELWQVWVQFRVFSDGVVLMTAQLNW